MANYFIFIKPRIYKHINFNSITNPVYVPIPPVIYITDVDLAAATASIYVDINDLQDQIDNIVVGPGGATPSFQQVVEVGNNVSFNDAIFKTFKVV